MSDHEQSMKEFINDCDELLEDTRGQLAYLAEEYNADLNVLTKEFISKLKEELNIKE
jgi:hypothetical protein